MQGVALLLAVIRVYCVQEAQMTWLRSGLPCNAGHFLEPHSFSSHRGQGHRAAMPIPSPLWVSCKLSTSVFVLSTCLVSLPDLNRTFVLSAPQEIEALRRHSLCGCPPASQRLGLQTGSNDSLLGSLRCCMQPSFPALPMPLLVVVGFTQRHHGGGDTWQVQLTSVGSGS